MVDSIYFLVMREIILLVKPIIEVVNIVEIVNLVIEI